MITNAVRYGPRPPETQVDHEIDATKAPIATEAVTVTYLTDPQIVAAVLPKPLQPADEPLVRVQLQRVQIAGRPPFGSAVFAVTAGTATCRAITPFSCPSPPNSRSPVGAKHSVNQRNWPTSRSTMPVAASAPPLTGWAIG